MTSVPSFALPEGARVLGTLWRALDLRLPKRRNESGRKFLRGKRALRDLGVLRDMASAFVNAGYIVRADDDTVRLLVDAMALAVARWDQLVGHASALSGANPKTSATRYLRLAAIDLAIRAAAFDIWAEMPPRPVALDDRPDSIPTWARDGGVRARLGVLLKTLTTRTASGAPQRRGERAASFGKAKDDWLYRGSRPSFGSLQKISDTLASANREATIWLSYLAWDLALDALCTDIAAIIGRAALEEIAIAFRRIRLNARQIFAAAVENAGGLNEHALGLLAGLIVEGARAADAGPLVDKLIDCELPAMIAGDASRYAWVIDLRGSRVDWTLSELSTFVPREPIAPDGVPEELLPRILVAIANRDNPHEFVDVCFSHPAALMYGVRLTVQRAFINGDFSTVAPMVAKFADAFQTPQYRLEAGILYALAGEFDDALRYLDGLGVEPHASIARPVVAVAKSLSGNHGDALAQLDSINDRDRVLDYVRGVALRGVGLVADALGVFEQIITDVPRHAMALEGAACCCYELAATSRGRTATKWTTRGNRYAKDATQLGRPDPRKSRQRPRHSKP